MPVCCSYPNLGLTLRVHFLSKKASRPTKMIAILIKILMYIIHLIKTENKVRIFCLVECNYCFGSWYYDGLFC